MGERVMGQVVDVGPDPHEVVNKGFVTNMITMV